MFRRKYWLLPLLLLLAAAAAAPFWLPAVARPLIRNDGPAKADIAVVLAGDYWGNRILKAASLVREGYVPAVLVSGPPYYGTHESDLAIAYAVEHGNPREWFISAPNDALSTREEARAILDVLRRRAVHNFLLVTSDYHTARSARLYRIEGRKLGFDPDFRVVAAPDSYFSIESWWRSREGLKTVFLEWSKTIATAFGV